MIFDAFVATLLSLLLFVKGRSTKPSCCPKVDPDAFRNVVSILIFSIFSLKTLKVAFCLR